ncbi:3-deoxy-7-phosphoheptulonate synthase [Candidatus Roizmanbacteria bacterium]|nr:3-deoxy-7-phosphoheptulonate synthase [Candidatus Roizmanbacteria bacterium]
MKTITVKDLIKKDKPLIIAGPCAVESKVQIKIIARKLHEIGVKVLRCQLWKPRTDPTSFQGIGLRGLSWIEKIKKDHGVLVATEITDKHQIQATKGIVDILWVGARNMQNYELLKALAQDRRPVILKRGLIATVDEWIKAGKYIGLNKVILCERGIRTGADSMRFTLDLNGALVAKHDHHMPVIIDPSHTAGRADMVPYLSYAGIAAGMDGIVVEVHHQPEKALSDASQQIQPEVFQEIIRNVNDIFKLRQQKGLIDETPFFYVKGLTPANKKSAKTLLSLAVKDRVGLLKDILTTFSDFGINLTMLRSEPSINKNYDYYFLIEVECTTHEPRLIQALNILKELCRKIEILEQR